MCYRLHRSPSFSLFLRSPLCNRIIHAAGASSSLPVPIHAVLTCVYPRVSRAVNFDDPTLLHEFSFFLCLKFFSLSSVSTETEKKYSRDFNSRSVISQRTRMIWIWQGNFWYFHSSECHNSTKICSCFKGNGVSLHFYIFVTRFLIRLYWIFFAFKNLGTAFPKRFFSYIYI